MEEAIDKYKEFLDGLVQMNESVQSARVRQGIWHPDPSEEQEKYNKLLGLLADEQLGLIADMIQEAADSAIHDALAYLGNDSFQIISDGTALPTEPFDNSMLYDYICRCEGMPWPNED